MSFKISRIKAMMDQTKILEAAEGTFTDKTLTIADPKWGASTDSIVNSQIYARIAVKVDGVPLSAIGRPLVDASNAPKFPRMMKLNKRTGKVVELIDK